MTATKTRLVDAVILPAPGVKPLPQVDAIVGQAGRDLTRCGYCGAESFKKNGLCRGHEDLGGVR